MQNYVLLSECPGTFKAMDESKAIVEQPNMLVNFFDDGYDEKECTRVCYEVGCSYLSFVYGPMFDQISNRIHLVPKTCKLYNSSATLEGKASSKIPSNEILCQSVIPGMILIMK